MLEMFRGALFASDFHCWQHRLGLQHRPGKPKNNTGHFYWNECFLHTRFSSYSSLQYIFLFSLLLPVLFLSLAQRLSVPVILDVGLESDFLRHSLSYSYSH